jgi:hypothetical protein
MMTQSYAFSGMWHSIYRVRRGSKQELTEVEHYCTLYEQGNQLVLETLPSADGSYMLARFTVDGRVITGTYHSQNSQKVSAKGAAYYGAAQLILSEDNNKLIGKAVGFGQSMKVKTSDWELTRIQDISSIKR